MRGAVRGCGHQRGRGDDEAPASRHRRSSHRRMMRSPLQRRPDAGSEQEDDRHHPEPPLRFRRAVGGWLPLARHHGERPGPVRGHREPGGHADPVQLRQRRHQLRGELIPLGADLLYRFLVPVLAMPSGHDDPTPLFRCLAADYVPSVPAERSPDAASLVVLRGQAVKPSGFFKPARLAVPAPRTGSRYSRIIPTRLR